MRSVLRTPEEASKLLEDQLRRRNENFTPRKPTQTELDYEEMREKYLDNVSDGELSYHG